MILAISSAPISRIFVAQRIADGASYSSVVSAKAAWVLETTSNPSRFNASPRRFAKYTLLSMRRTLTARPALPQQHFRNVADRNDPATSQDHAFQFRCSVWKTKNAAGGHELGNLFRRNGKPPFAQPQQDERLQFEFGRYRHCAQLVPSGSSLASLSACKRAASSKANSSGDKNPSGCTTGTTV